MDPIEEDKEEIQRIAALLEEVCHRSRRSRRDLERSLGLGHGYLNHLFAGRMDLKLRHVFQILRELKLDPHQFLRDAFAPPVGDPAAAPPTAAPSAAAPAERKPGLDRALFKELLREIVRDELEDMAAASRPAQESREKKPSPKKSR
jgi:hypothetical protein